MTTIGAWLIAISIIIGQLVPVTVLDFEYLTCKIVSDGKSSIEYLIHFNFPEWPLLNLMNTVTKDSKRLVRVSSLSGKSISIP